MKRFILGSLSILFVVTAPAQQTLRDALRAPNAAKEIQLSGDPDQVNIFIRNAKSFTQLESVRVDGLNDDALANRLCGALQTNTTLQSLSFTNGQFHNFPSAISDLKTVQTLTVNACPFLDLQSVCNTIQSMPALTTWNLQVGSINALPASLAGLRHLKTIAIVNTDKQLADGYAVNTRGYNALRTTLSSQLGFDNSAIQASSLTLTYTCYDAELAKQHLQTMADLLQGVRGTTGTLALVTRPQAFERKHPLVHEPMPGISVMKNIYSVDATRGGSVDYPSGTSIQIPAQAFVDRNGNLVNGPVTIDYREFRDAADVIVSGIPMSYDSGGVAGQFQSAGMFELNASINGQEVFLAPGKKVAMNFSVTDSASSYNFYRLDEQKGWVYEGKPGAKTEVKDIVQKVEAELSESMSYFQKMTSTRRIPRIGDTTHFEERYADTNYAYTTKKTDSYSQLLFKRNKKTFSYIDFRKAKTGRDYTCFWIQNRVWPEHRELGTFRSYAWQINERMNYKTFKQRLGKDRCINDLRVKYDGASFYLEVKDDKGFETIPVTLVKVMKHGKPVAVAPKECQRLYTSYSKQLQTRKKTFERSITKKKKDFARALKKSAIDSTTIWRETQRIMTKDELRLSYSNWLKLYKERLAAIRAATDGLVGNVTNVLRSISLDGFGIYNCDQLQRLDRPVTIFAYCEQKGQTHFPASTIYIIDKSKQSVLTYTTSYDALGLKKITPSNTIATGFSPYVENTLLAVDTHGKMAVAHADAFTGRDFTEYTKVGFVVEQVPDSLCTVADVRKMIGGK